MNQSRIARVFPRRTKATPSDALAFTGPPGLFPPQVDEVHVSVTLSWDLPYAQKLARQWEGVAPVKIGGPATEIVGNGFIPGMYLKPGYTITSRGCPNRCWFCEVWRRDGVVRELPIAQGWNLLDDNLLACSPKHIMDVITMLRNQPKPPEFTGGLEAARLQPWIAEAILSIAPKQVFFAYDEPSDWEPLVNAVEICKRVGFKLAPRSHVLRAYVLIGWPKDTMEAATHRLEKVARLGLMPMAMLWRGNDGKIDAAWRTFQRQWARPQILASKMQQLQTGSKPESQMWEIHRRMERGQREGGTQ